MAHGPAKGLSRWLFTTNHKDIGSMYLWFSFAMFILGGAFAMVIRAELFQPGMQLVEPEFLQPDDYHARSGDGVWCHHAFFRRSGELDDPDDDRCAGYGVATDEQLFILVVAVCFLIAGINVVYGGWCAQFRLDFLCAAVHHLCATISNFLYLRCPRDGCFFHHGFNQHYCHSAEYARTWHDIDENAAVCLDVVDHCILVDCCYAGTGWRGHHDVDGYSLWHFIL
jgi:hypothetical protein